MGTSSVTFAAAARAIGTAGRARGLRVPAFRSPPRVRGAERTLRRWRDGGATVSVVLRDRPLAAVVADMVEGVVVVNGLTGVDATRARTALWEAVTAGAPEVTDVVAGSCAGRRAGPPAGGTGRAGRAAA